MIDAVLLFGALNVVFEFILLSMLPPRARLRVLGSQGLRSCVHVMMLGINLIVHWGTLVGSMSAILAFCASILTTSIAAGVYGTIVGRTYKPGLVRYPVEVLR